MTEISKSDPPWPFLSRYAHVILCLVEDPHIRMREIATRLDVTERSVQKLILRLEKSGVLSRHREGRNNRYEIDLEAPLGHDFEAGVNFADLLNFLLESRGANDAAPELLNATSRENRALRNATPSDLNPTS